MSRAKPQRWQVWYYRWSTIPGGKPIPERAALGGQEFPTKYLAMSAWYDSCPGRNDKHIVVLMGSTVNGVKIPTTTEFDANGLTRRPA